MKINERLKQVAKLVDPNSICLDIGCDHALLDIYLVKNKLVKKSIASDNKEGPLAKAKENIKFYNLEDEIELRLGNGLDIYTSDIDTIIISGMGGLSIIGIFKYQLSKIKNVKEVIISSNNHQEDVRRFFTHIGFKIEEEVLVEDGKIIYQIIKFIRGRKFYTKKDYFFGPILLKKKNALFKKYYKNEVTSRKILIQILPKNYKLKKYITKKEIKNIEKELEN